MFEMQYDKNGVPIKQPEPVQPSNGVENTDPTAQADSTTESLENLQEMTQELEQKVVESESDSIKVEAHSSETETHAAPERPNDRNVRALREKAKRAEELERERDELMRAYIAMQSKMTTNQTQTTPQEEEFSIGENDLVEGKHLAKIERKYQKKLEELEKKYSQYEQKTQEMTVETRIKNQFPDFDKVVSPDNIDYLRENEPELAYTINSSPDLYSKAVAAYKLIKNLGIYRPDTYEKDRALAQKNAAKPKPLNTISPQQGESPLSNANAFANGLTPELKDQLLKEMIQARKGM